MQETFNPDLFVAKWYCSKIGPEDMPRFAADALEAGHDGPALRRLAGLLRPTSAEVGDLFQRALGEIGTVTILSKEQALLSLSRSTAVDIIGGKLDPIEGARILARYAMMLNYPPILVEFLQLSEMPFWGEYAPPRAQIVTDIIEEARLLVTSVPA
jgi:hypothetical protein